MKRHLLLPSLLLLTSACATPKPRPMWVDEEAPTPATPSDEPEAAAEPGEEGEIDLGFDGGYSNVQIQATTTGDEPAAKPVRSERKPAEIGQPCGGLMSIRCQKGLYCKEPENVTHTDAMGRCEVEPVNGRRQELESVPFEPRPGYK